MEDLRTGKMHLKIGLPTIQHTITIKKKETAEGGLQDA